MQRTEERKRGNAVRPGLAGRVQRRRVARLRAAVRVLGGLRLGRRGHAGALLQLRGAAVGGEGAVAQRRAAGLAGRALQ